MIMIQFHQVVRAMTPVFTVMLNVLFLKKVYSGMVYTSLIPVSKRKIKEDIVKVKGFLTNTMKFLRQVIAGVAFATFGDYNYTAMGFILTVLGTVLAAIKTVVTNRVQVGRLKLHPLDLLLRMSPLAFIQTMLYSYATGEMELVQEYFQTNLTTNVFFALLLNGIIAFFLNVVSFTANKKTSALTMTVAGTYFYYEKEDLQESKSFIQAM